MNIDYQIEEFHFLNAFYGNLLMKTLKSYPIYQQSKLDKKNSSISPLRMISTLTNCKCKENCKFKKLLFIITQKKIKKLLQKIWLIKKWIKNKHK